MHGNRYRLGLDIGISSLGYAGIRDFGDLQPEIQPDLNPILFAGVHIFDSAEDPKTRASLALPRRTARGQRRVIARRRMRKQKIRNLLRRQGLGELDETILDPWQLRKKGLERRLNEGEWARVLFHIARHRGFQSNRKNVGTNEKDEEGKKTQEGNAKLTAAMIEAGCKTIGEFIAIKDKKRNGNGNYDNFVMRDQLRSEVRVLFDTQRRLGNPHTDSAFQTEYSEYAFFQRPLKSFADKVGYCTFFPAEKRAAKHSYSAEMFILWGKINHLRILDSGTERSLNPEERELICDMAHEKANISHADLRKKLKLPDTARFNISYFDKDGKKKGDAKQERVVKSWETIRDECEKANKFIALPGFHALKDALKGTGRAWAEANTELLNQIAQTLSFENDETAIRKNLPNTLNETEIQALLNIPSFSKTVDLSIKAIEKILPYMRQGMIYDKACEAAGINFKANDRGDFDKIPAFEDTRNPVVNRALAQARKVINAIIGKYGMPSEIIIELARDFGKSADERTKIEREQKANQIIREKAREGMAEFFGTTPENIRGDDILKHRLWKEQGGFCLYSGEVITPEILRDANATQIDHIIPYSRCWDDSYMNKVLCMTDENQRKGNSTAFEYLGHTDRWQAVLAAIKSLKSYPFKKRDRFLMETIDEKGFKDRNLNDTRYMAKLLKNHLERNLRPPSGRENSTWVQTRNGNLTAHLRGAWGFAAKNRDNDRHHALDAIVIACSTQSNVQAISSWDKRDPRKRGEKPSPPVPWEGFRNDALAAVNKIFVSRMPQRGVTGAAHEDTIRSIRDDGAGGKIAVQRIGLTSVTMKKLEDMVDKDRNRALYDVLAERLRQFGDDPKKAFVAPIYMPTKDGKQGPQIKGIRIITNEKTGIAINHGLASNGDMVRVDVFKRGVKFYLVPIYAHHFAGTELPNRAIVAGKPESEWLEMKEEEFIFSLCKNDLVELVQKGEDTTTFGYYVGVDRSNARISLKEHDDPKINGKSKDFREYATNALDFRKYRVDYFGNKTWVKREKRQHIRPRKSNP